MSPYDKQNPFLASIKQRYSLCKSGSGKRTSHVVLDLHGSNLIYHVGDSVGIYAHNADELIEKTLKILGATGDELITPKQGGSPLTVYDYFKYKASLTEVPQKLLRELSSKLKCSDKKQSLDELLKPENHAALKLFLSQHEVWDLLESHREVSFEPQELADILMPLLPRFYSIASSQNHVGSEVHLTVAPVEYETRGHQRRGVCTHFLLNLCALNNPSVPLFIQPTHSFRPPENHEQAMIMIGPGTGIAPFRAFMQERMYKSAKGDHWLFFGEWNKDSHFFYEEEWRDWADRGLLRLETAFSRDQSEKVYVQHKMQENGSEIFDWLENGAHIYVCGDANKMAKDVEAMLLEIIQAHGKRDLARARDYVKKLRQEKRYLRDVY